MAHQKLSILIPVYNERSTIEQVLNRVKAASILNLKKEIILVDDCSTDGTTEFLKNLDDASLKVIFHEKNQGKGAALHTGFASATGDIVIIQDADLEYNPAQIETVIRPILESGAKVVYGSRYLKVDEKLGFWHSFFNKLFTAFGNILIHQKITDLMTCYKAFDREVLSQLIPNLESKRFGFEPEVTARVSKLGYHIVEVPISYHPRTQIQGKHMNFSGQIESLWSLIKYTIIKPR